eukprot:6182556-Pleurochrysis_carterae.AAC.1
MGNGHALWRPRDSEISADESLRRRLLILLSALKLFLSFLLLCVALTHSLPLFWLANFAREGDLARSHGGVGRRATTR